jgi:hypothetical protein
MLKGKMEATDIPLQAPPISTSTVLPYGIPSARKTIDSPRPPLRRLMRIWPAHCASRGTPPPSTGATPAINLALNLPPHRFPAPTWHTAWHPTSAPHCWAPRVCSINYPAFDQWQQTLNPRPGTSVTEKKIASGVYAPEALTSVRAPGANF